MCELHGGVSSGGGFETGTRLLGLVDFVCDDPAAGYCLAKALMARGPFKGKKKKNKDPQRPH